MLELRQVIAEIGQLGAEVKRRRGIFATQLEVGLSQARLSEQEWADKQAACAGNKQPWPAARCDFGTPGATYALPYPAPEIYAALATDGSQIPLDRHAIALCYLLNVGEVTLYYGTKERPRLHSRAALYYRDEDIYQRDSAGDSVPLSDKIIANRRLLAESESLKQLIEENSERVAIALVDDPLIIWTPQGETEAEQRPIIAKFCEMLEQAKECGTPIIGYISRPGHWEVVGALRRTLCIKDCPHLPDSPCATLRSLTDSQLFAALLTQMGERSELFGSNAKALSLYPEDQQIYFFYINTGSEIARVEIPKWVAEESALLEMTHVLCFDQIRKGQGYPIALAEAHEHAVVRAPERDAFFQLIESAFIRENIPALTTRKAFAKRRPLL